MDILARLLMLVFSCLILNLSAASADYLEVRRPAEINDHPLRNSIVVDRADNGRFLTLMDDGARTNGYYRVVVQRTGRPGWIYRTYVRRYRGDPPGGAAVIFPNNAPPENAVSNGTAMRAHYIDVGQGDATLLEFSCGAVLIDAGGFSSATNSILTDYLRRFFDRREDLNDTLSAIFVTHTHVDHNRALKEVVSSFKVGNYIHNGVLRGSGRHNAKWMVQTDNQYTFGITKRAVVQPEVEQIAGRQGLRDEIIDPVDCSGTDPNIRVLSGTYTENPGWPDHDFEDGNNKSLVIRIDFGESSFLFTGDLEEQGIEQLVRYYEGTDMLDVDVYQVGHHGSHNGTTQSLMKAMTADIAVLSMGNKSVRENWTAWAYGHPRISIVELLDNWIDRPRTSAIWVDVANAVRSFQRYRMRDSVYGTGWDGNIVVTADRAGNKHISTSTAPGS